MKTNEIITDEQLNNAWGNADFGDLPKRKVLANALLKYASGYSTGKTISCIADELGLITKSGKLSALGKKYLFAAFCNGISI